jgi:hypothetical protein
MNPHDEELHQQWEAELARDPEYAQWLDQFEKDREDQAGALADQFLSAGLNPF